MSQLTDRECDELLMLVPVTCDCGASATQHYSDCPRKVAQDAVRRAYAMGWSARATSDLAARVEAAIAKWVLAKAKYMTARPCTLCDWIDAERAADALAELAREAVKP